MTCRLPVSGRKTLLSLSGLLFSLFLSLSGHAQQTAISRGPYLQQVTPESMTIRWRTVLPTDNRVRYGTSPGQFTQQFTDTARTTEHIVRLTGLQPATRYYYSIGDGATDGTTRAYQSFTTAPPKGSSAPVRIWALGDFGSGNQNQRDVRDQFLKASATRPADLWLWLGDNAYCCGREQDFQQYVFDTYPTILPGLPFWPTPGNHDYADNVNNFDNAYYKLITVPQQGEAGGVPSGSKAYFSFDYGQIHFVSLDSYGLEAGKFRLYDTTGTQAEWLKRDLAANRQPWTIVFFHHPPYAKGQRNADTDPEMTAVRQRVLPILERFNVDLVLLGHSHTYERSYQLHGFSGTYDQFDLARHAVSSTTGRYDGSANSCPIIQKGKGTVYVVNGSGGQIGGQTPGWPHPAMVYANNTIGGSMIIDVLENRLDAKFIMADGVTRDQFTIMKNVSRTQTLTVPYGETARLTASWPAQNETGPYRWSDGTVGKRTLSVAPAKSARFTVADEQGCLQDVFDVTVLQPTGLEPGAEGRLSVFPNPTTDFVTVKLTLNAPAPIEWHLTDLQGRCVSERTYPKSGKLEDHIALPDGGKVFFLKVKAGKEVFTRKIVRN